MAAEYTGTIALAQTAIALNMAYIALERFRYRKQIRQKFSEAQSTIEDMPQDYTNDLAWKNVKDIAAGASAKSWTVGRIAYWLYYVLFQKSLDIAAAYALACLSGLILIAQAYTEFQPTANWGQAYVASAYLGGVVFVLPALGVVAPVGFVLAGRYAVRCAERSIEDNMAHLASRMRLAAQEGVDGTLETLRE